MSTSTAISGSLTAAAVLTKPRDDERRFFATMVYICGALIAIAGFVPTYWAPVASGTFTGSPILHVHGLLFSAWPILFIVQARLAAAGPLRSSSHARVRRNLAGHGDAVCRHRGGDSQPQGRHRCGL